MCLLVLGSVVEVQCYEHCVDHATDAVEAAPAVHISRAIQIDSMYKFHSRARLAEALHSLICGNIQGSGTLQ